MATKEVPRKLTNSFGYKVSHAGRRRLSDTPPLEDSPLYDTPNDLLEYIMSDLQKEIYRVAKIMHIHHFDHPRWTLID